MPSLRKRVTTYLRQLSFTAESRDRIGLDRANINKAGCSITRYIEGDSDVLVRGPIIHSGKTPQTLPDLPIASYPMGCENVTAACTGPGEGLACVQRSCLHLSAGPDIDFIDTQQDSEDVTSTNRNVPVIQNNTKNAEQSILNPLNENVNKIIAPSEPNTVTCKNLRNDNEKHDKNICAEHKSESIAESKNEIAQNTSLEITENIVNLNNIQDSVNVPTSDTDSQSSVDTSQNKTEHTNKELSKIEKEKLRLRNLPKYECRRTKTLSETVLTRPRKNLKSNDKTQNIVLVTKTLQVNTSIEQNVNKNVQNVVADKVLIEKEAESKSNEPDRSENLNKQNVDSVISELDVSNSNVENSIMQNAKTDTLHGAQSSSETIAGVNSWDSETDYAYGISTSLYEHNPLLGDRAGQPIADCYGLIARGDIALLALADGVNWGNGAKLAACSAVHGCLSYLNRAIFGLKQGSSELTTHEVFVSLLRSFWEAHACIIESGGALCTLTAAVILPLDGKDAGRSVVCVCNVGDSLAYVYSHVYGVREITQGSHDINSMRDMRDALGALGPVNGTNPELNNLTLSMTIVEPGDLVFLTSDGVSDNFDPVVGRFAEPMSQNKENPHMKAQLNPNSKRTIQNKTNVRPPESSVNRGKRIHSKTDSNLTKNVVKSNRLPHESSNRTPNDNIQSSSRFQTEQGILKSKTQPISTNPLAKKSVALDNSASRPKYSRSHTTLEPRNKVYVNPKNIVNRPNYNRSMSDEHSVPPKKQLIPLPRSKNGLPIVNGLQRHDLTLLRMADLLNFGINGLLKPCTTSKALCKLLIDFVRMITTGKRKMLEEKELYYCERNGVLVELTRSQQKAKRKEWIEKEMFKALPGKLDHASVVAYTIGGGTRKPAYCETDF